MKKTILITGSTDGIGLETARMLIEQGQNVILHGRNPDKLKKVAAELSQLSGKDINSYVADLSIMKNVETLAKAVLKKHTKIDVLINNAGVYNAPEPVTNDGLDIRFAVNTIAPYLLTKMLLPLMDPSGRVINLSSAAQAPVDPDALVGKYQLLPASMAYAQSKLAITMWSRYLANELKSDGPSVISVNPGSMLGSKMVKEAYGVSGGDLRIGADILCRASLSDEFAGASGKYFDNDSRRFNSPHPHALNMEFTKGIIDAIEIVLAGTTRTSQTGD